ncbi:MAG: Double zinc ribbon [Clostridiales bacterium]|jgi:hypothetical protein|nr:Double zinc ribbon [Clostridiales bacterium]MDN5281271.1 Double zinc ribbon [Candidatus Ozemobacter sp.]
MKLRTLTLVLFILVGLTGPAWALYCPACGFLAPDEDRFCRQCGQALTEKPAPGTQTRIKQPEPAPEFPERTITKAKPAPKPFQVTSHYLLVNGNRLYKKSLFWIAEVQGGQARVWSVEGPEYDRLVMGWVSLNELERRSTLTSSSDIYCIEPPTVSKVVVFERRSFWHHWGPRPFHFSGSIRWHPHRRYDRYHRYPRRRR